MEMFQKCLYILENSSINPINVKRHHIKDSETKQEGREYSAWVLVEISKQNTKELISKLTDSAYGQ